MKQAAKRMILVFDLDDTLYDEINFVKSGYHAVAKWLEEAYQLPANELYEEMIGELDRSGRGKVFDAVLERHGILSKSAVARCLATYRLHRPDIQLNKDALACLERFAGYPKYIVTDGNKVVQANKVKALGLDNGGYGIKKAFITYRYGLKHSKPSPYCLLKISSLEKVPNDRVVYIGDNPNKDFVGIKPLGFKTIRIVQGMFKAVVKGSEYEADLQIRSLDELTESKLNTIFNH